MTASRSCSLPPSRQQRPKSYPPPIDNTLSNNALVETIKGKTFTTSRKLAALLGRNHGNVLDTIKNNLHRREFKYGHFVTRNYTSGPSGHGYEYMITRRGLSLLAGVMRYGAKGKIEEAYKGAWTPCGKTDMPVLPMPEAIEEEAKPAQAETATDESDGEITYTPEQQKYIDWLEGYNEVLGDSLRKTRAAKELYADLYENEKKRRLRNGEAMGYWHDLYEDLMLRLIKEDDGLLAEKLEAHRAFRERISKHES